jgi:hypothetical protein
MFDAYLKSNIIQKSNAFFQATFKIVLLAVEGVRKNKEWTAFYTMRKDRGHYRICIFGSVAGITRYDGYHFPIIFTDNTVCIWELY